MQLPRFISTSIVLSFILTLIAPVAVEAVQFDRDVKIAPVTTPTSTETGTDGSHRGAGIGILKNAVETMIEILLGVEFGSLARDSYPVTSPVPPPPPSFPIIALSEELKDLICRAKVMTERHGDLEDSIPYVSSIIATHTDIPVGTVNAALTTEGFCSAYKEARREGGVVVAKEPIMKFTIVEVVLAVDEDGIPVSSSPVWNACIRGTVYRDATGNPSICRDEGSRRDHPDLPGLSFTWNMRRKTMTNLPENTHIVVIDSTDETEMLRLAELHNAIAWSVEESTASKSVITAEEIIDTLGKKCMEQVADGADRELLAVCRTHDRLRSDDTVL